MSAIDNQNAAAASAEDLKLQQEQLKTQQSLVDAVKSYLSTIAERCATIQSITEDKSDDKSDDNSNKKEKNEKGDIINKLTGNMNGMVKSISGGFTGFMKVLNPKNLFKDNKKDTLLKKTFFKLVGKNLTKLVKQNEKEAAAPAGGNGGAPGAPGGQGQTGGNNQNNNAISAKDAVNMGKQIGGMLAESLNPAKLITTFIKVIIPKILIAILLLTIFIEAFFDVDFKQALDMAINIVIAAFLLYITWQIAKVAFKIAFEMMCQSIVTSAELGKVAIELAESFMVYAAFLIIIPLILLCFVILVALIYVVVIAILNTVTEIMKLVCDTIIKCVDLFFKYLFGLGGDSSEKNEKRKEEETAKYDPNDAKALVEAFIDTATTAVVSILNWCDAVAGTAILALGSVILVMVKFMTLSLLWLTNPIFMMASAIVAGLASISGGSNKPQDESSFSKALEPLLLVVQSIETILKKYTGGIKSISSHTFNTVTKASINKWNENNSSMQFAMPSDKMSETHKVGVAANMNTSNNVSSNDSSNELVIVLKSVQKTLEDLNKTIAKKNTPVL